MITDVVRLPEAMNSDDSVSVRSCSPRLPGRCSPENKWSPRSLRSTLKKPLSYEDITTKSRYISLPVLAFLFKRHYVENINKV